MTLKKEGNIDFSNAIKELKKLNHKEVLVGFFGEKDSQLLTIVRANEYGAHIQPKNGEWLWIPTDKVPKGKGPKDFNDLFIPKGKHVAVRNEGGKLVTYFYLVKNVTIPARPFIRKSLANNKKKYQRMISNGIKKIVFGKYTADKLLNALGSTAVADMRMSAVRLKNPKNAPATIERKGRDNPLIDTHEMVERITYKVIDI